MIGKMVGAFWFGAMSDAIGRFRTYFISLILQLIFERVEEFPYHIFFVLTSLGMSEVDTV